MKKKNTILGASDPVVMASFRTGIRDPNLLKKLARRAPESVKDIFNMADRYASQEEAVAAENYDRPRQNQRKDNAESSKSKGQKCKGDDLVAAAERSRPLSHPVLKAKPGVNHMCARIKLSHMGDQMNIIITVFNKS